MRQTVQPVADALRSLPASDRALWREVWSKAGVVVAAEATAREPAFRDTRELRAYTGLAIDIAWRRIGGHAAGSQESLRKAVEAAYAAAVGTDDVPVTADTRGRYVELAKALAWAGG
jgi:ribosomal protein S18